MHDENMKLMHQRRNQHDFDRQLNHVQVGTSPSAIGDGYRRQLAAMQEHERVKSMQMQHYAANVGSPARQKQLQEMQNENAMVYNSQQMLNQRALMAAEYHSKLKEDHKQKLLN